MPSLFSSMTGFQKAKHRFLFWSSLCQNSNGFAPIAVLLLLVIGIGVSTFVVQNRTNFSPKAAERGYCEGGYRFVGSDEGDNAGDDSQWVKDESCDEEEEEDDNLKTIGDCKEEQKDDECYDGVYIHKIYQNCEGTYRRVKTDKKCDGSTDPIENSDKSEEDCKKAGGSWRDNRCFTPSNPKPAQGEQKCEDDITYCDSGKAIRKHGGYWDGNKCIYDFYNIEEKNSECTPAKNAKNGDVVSVSEEEEKKYDAERESERQIKDAKSCDAITYCDKGKKIRKYGVYDEEKKKCDDRFEQTDQDCPKDKDGKNLPDGSVIGGADQAVAVTKAKMLAQQKQTQELKSNLDALKPQLQTLGNQEALDKVTAAQTAIDQAQAKYDECIQKSEDEATKTTCDAAHKVLVQQSRSAIFNALTAGANGKCVKADFGDVDNLMEVAPGRTAGANSALFLCRPSASTDGQPSSLVWRVRDATGNLVEPSATSLQKLGIDPTKQVKTADDIPEKVRTAAQKAECLALGGASCVGVSASTGAPAAQNTATTTRATKAGEAADKAGNNETDPIRAAGIKAKTASDTIRQDGGTETEQVQSALSSAMAHLMRKDKNLTTTAAKTKAVEVLQTQSVFTKAILDKQLATINTSTLPTRESINKEVGTTSTTTSTSTSTSTTTSTTSTDKLQTLINENITGWAEEKTSYCTAICKSFPSTGKCLVRDTKNMINCADNTALSQATTRTSIIKAMCLGLKNTKWESETCKSTCAGTTTFWVDGKCSTGCPNGKKTVTNAQGKFCSDSFTLPKDSS